jgi:hypothetical protein
VQTAQFPLADPFFMQEFAQHLGQVRNSKLIFAVNLVPTLCQVLFQPPDVLRDLAPGRPSVITSLQS